MFCAFIKKKEVPNIRVMNSLPVHNPCHICVSLYRR